MVTMSIYKYFSERTDVIAMRLLKRKSLTAYSLHSDDDLDALGGDIKRFQIPILNADLSGLLLTLLLQPFFWEVLHLVREADEKENKTDQRSIANRAKRMKRGHFSSKGHTSMCGAAEKQRGARDNYQIILDNQRHHRDKTSGKKEVQDQWRNSVVAPVLLRVQEILRNGNHQFNKGDTMNIFFDTQQRNTERQSGSNQRYYGKRECKLCQRGQYANKNTAATECISCPSGQYGSGEAVAQRINEGDACDNCGIGKYSLAEGATLETSCSRYSGTSKIQFVWKSFKMLRCYSWLCRFDAGRNQSRSRS